MDVSVPMSLRLLEFHGLSRNRTIRSRGRDSLTDTQNLNGNLLVLAAMMICEIHDLQIVLVPPYD